jgi:hypothetical protein
MLGMRRLLWIAVLVSVPACRYGDGLARVEVQGNVTYQGTPVQHGLITFRPVHGSKAPAAGTGIVDGKFFLPAQKGPIAGPHEVEVEIADAAKDSTTSDESARAMHRAGNLKSFSQQVEVKSGFNEFEFSFTATPPSPEKSGPK